MGWGWRIAMSSRPAEVIQQHLVSKNQTKVLVANILASSPIWSFYHKANDPFGRFHNRSPNLERALVLGVPRKTTLPVPGRLTFIQWLNQMVLGSQSLEDTLTCLPITLLREIQNIFQSKGQQINVNLNYTEKPSNKSHRIKKAAFWRSATYYTDGNPSVRVLATKTHHPDF